MGIGRGNSSSKRNKIEQESVEKAGGEIEGPVSPNLPDPPNNGQNDKPLSGDNGREIKADEACALQDNTGNEKNLCGNFILRYH